MRLFSRIAGKRLRLTTPDWVERRNGHMLMVWGDVPHWMVMDEEMGAFLNALDGSVGLGNLISGHPKWESHRGLLLDTARQLLESRVLQDLDSGGATAPLGVADVPIESVAINLTRRCNRRCVFCYNLDHLDSQGDGELSAKEIGGFLDDIRPCLSSRATVVILGGEPLLEAEKLLVVSQHVRELGLTALMSTNGLLVTSEFAEQARAAGLQVQVSLDGHTAELHDALRGAGTFDRAVAGVQILVESGAFTILSMVCHAGNVGQLGDYYELALRLGVNAARFIPLKLLGGGARAGLRPVGMLQLMRAASAIFRAHPEYLKLAGRDAFSILANTCRYSARRPGCGTGLQTVLLDADGALYPCLNLNQPELRIANVRDAGYRFEKLWRSSPVLERVRRRSAVETPGRTCSRCAVRHWCLGGCRGEAMAATGDLSAPSPQCNELRRAVVEMMWVLAESPELVRPATYVC